MSQTTLIELETLTFYIREMHWYIHIHTNLLNYEDFYIISLHIGL